MASFESFIRDAGLRMIDIQSDYVEMFFAKNKFGFTGDLFSKLVAKNDFISAASLYSQCSNTDLVEGYKAACREYRVRETVNSIRKRLKK